MLFTSIFGAFPTTTTSVSTQALSTTNVLLSTPTINAMPPTANYSDVPTTFNTSPVTSATSDSMYTSYQNTYALTTAAEETTFNKSLSTNVISSPEITAYKEMPNSTTNSSNPVEINIKTTENVYESSSTLPMTSLSSTAVIIVKNTTFPTFKTTSIDFMSTLSTDELTHFIFSAPFSDFPFPGKTEALKSLLGI